MNKIIPYIFLLLTVIIVSIENPLELRVKRAADSDEDDEELNDDADSVEDEQDEDEEDESSENSENEDSSDELAAIPNNLADFLRDNDDLEDYDDEDEDENISNDENDDDDEEDDDDEGGTGIKSKLNRWPKSDVAVIIPYFIDKESGYSAAQVSNITAALKRIEYRTCVRFVPYQDETNYIEFQSVDDLGCKSPIGMREFSGNVIKLNKNKKNCMRIATVMHEVIHSLGFGHMHKHSKRDNFIRINWDNIEESNIKERSYYRLNTSYAGSFGTEYDFFSVMHYGPIRKNSQVISTRKGYKFYEPYMGQRRRMSEGDVERINNMYDCMKIFRNKAPAEYDDYFDGYDDDDESE